ncbi:PEP-CTERM protein-sorting domain-containing protein [Noviherbaspirillum humi]|uniref:PEP-CTERM protein-sorting domain-containing protein n=1 Tax=Noviherbaspirillum humi TaxID=1688639 RepID=A0A239HKG8_9BURK|nr:PEP-CTERM sorting domain-containing protein [Noviherbaspirillum humi]SNS81889.1 PEP-CTERM protein-sorting domain-containing protein [Noviherbaspirillum humi]
MKKLLTVLLAAGVMTTAAAPSFATPTLRLTSGAVTKTVVDNAANDATEESGVVGYMGSVGDFSLSVTTGVTKPYQGDEYNPYLDLNSLSGTSGKAGTLKLEFTETGFLSIDNVLYLLSQIGGTINNANGSSLTYDVYADASNAAFGTGTQLLHAQYGTGAFSNTDFLKGDLTNPFSLTIVATLTHGAGGTSSFDAFVGVPEPTTLGLLGIGVLALGRTRKKHKSKSL